ncbi:MFS transporter [Kribbella sp. NPDC003505]|uniref:MFS transporter n=1 Tax=Kribbella sp. NPDC003505 TaxID=3154448 RepID=UPI00339E7F83
MKASRLSVASMPSRPSLREVIAVSEFRALWFAHAQSRFGDQIARVAIALLVFERTESALLTAVTYALSLLPPLVSAPLLTGLADRFSRRNIMVVTDFSRACLVAVMAIPGLPMAILALLLTAVVSLQPLYSAARNAVLPAVLDGDRYVVGLGLVTATDSAVQVLGFAGGGALVGLIGSHAAVGLDAVTFLISATLVATSLGRHTPTTPVASTTGRSLSAGVRLLCSDRRLRCLLGLSYLYGFYIAPEGLAVAYAADEGAPEAAVGLLMAADPVGALLGSLVLTRWLPAHWRTRSLAPLAAVSAVPLVVSALFPSIPTAVGLWALVGVLSSYTVLVTAIFVRLVPDAQRGQVIGLASAGLQAAQGLGVTAAGAVADATSPAAAVGIMGAAGGLLAVPIGVAWSRATARVRDDGTRDYG